MSDLPVDASAKGFVAHWERVGPLLAELNRKEQRELTDEEHLQAVANVLELARPDPIPSQTSGLVEQQQYFSKAHK